MALVPLLTTPHLNVPQHTFHGQPGAFRILVQLTRYHRSLNASHNPLGLQGVDTLVSGFEAMRWRLVPPIESDDESDEDDEEQVDGSEQGGPQTGTDGTATGKEAEKAPRGGWEGPPRNPGRHERGWGMATIDLGECELGDEGFIRLLEYCKGWQWCRHLDLPSNRILLQPDCLPRLLPLLRSTRLRSLNLSSNPLTPSSVPLLLRSLPPTVDTLRLSLCYMPSSCAPALGRLVRSSMGQNLASLHLNGNELGLGGVSHVLDALEEGNCRMLSLGLAANGIPNPVPHNEDLEDPVAGTLDDAFPTPPAAASGQRSQEIDVEFLRRRARNDDSALNEQVHVRLPDLLTRNHFLAGRVRQAALNAYGPARVLLNARPRPRSPQPDLPAAATSHAATSEATSTSTTPLAYFPLFRLPPHLVSLIVMHCSSDPSALSSAQWQHLKSDATDRAAWAGRRDRRRKWKQDMKVRAERKAEEALLRDRWIRKGGWDKWEEDRKYESESDDEVEEKLEEGGG